MKPYFYLRSMAGGMIVIAVTMQLINLYMTIRSQPIDRAGQRRKQIAEMQELSAPAGAFDDRTVAVD